MSTNHGGKLNLVSGLISRDRENGDIGPASRKLAAEGATVNALLAQLGVNPAPVIQDFPCLQLVNRRQGLLLQAGHHPG